MILDQPTTGRSTSDRSTTAEGLGGSGRRVWWRWPATTLGWLLRPVDRVAQNHPSWAGVVAGLATGVALTILFTTYVQPHLGPDAGLEPGPLVILSGRDDSAGGQRQALLDQWNALHPNNPARVEELPSSSNAERHGMVARAQSGTAEVDIYNLDVPYVAEFAAAGRIRPLSTDGLDTSGFLANPLSTCRNPDLPDPDALWCLPFNTDAGLLYYRTDLVSGAPSTWDRLTTDADRALAAPSTRHGRLEAGFTTQLASYEGLVVNVQEAVWWAGGEIVDEHGRVRIGDPEARRGLRRLVDGLRRDNPRLILPDSLEFNEDRSTQAFRDGRTVFLRNWPVAYRLLSPAGAGGASRVPFGVSALPGPSVLGGQNLAVAADTPRPRAAQALIEFLTSPRSQQILFERGGFAATQEVVYTDAAILARYPYASELRNAIDAARPRPVTPHYVLFGEVLREAVYPLLVHGGDLPDDLPRRLAAALDGRRLR